MSLESKVHDRTNFSCGVPELDLYIKNLASQNAKRNMARVFVALDHGSHIVVGYYSLSAASFQRNTLPDEATKGLPDCPVPAVLLGRLAVDKGQQKCGLGAYLLMDAFKRICQANEFLATQALIVDIKDDAIASFYQKFGFHRFGDNKRRMFLPLVTVRKLIRE